LTILKALRTVRVASQKTLPLWLWVNLAANEGVGRERKSLAARSANRLRAVRRLRDGKMTAEIAVLNKAAVALAADSIVTIISSRGEKTYNTSNKLFTLSKRHPVGVLTYGDTDIDRMPVEIMIKEYRERLKDAHKPSIKDYSDAFLEFIRDFPPKGTAVEEKVVIGISRDHADTLRKRFRRECRQAGFSPAGLSSFSVEMNDAYERVLDRFEQESADAGQFPALQSFGTNDLMSAHPNVIEDAVDEEFDRYGPIQVQKDRAANAIATRILSNIISYASTGIVIAGYGNDEYYPSLSEHDIEGTILGKLKLWSEDVFSIDDVNSSMTVGFAQKDAADAFMNGIDPGYQNFIDDGIREILPSLSDIAAKHFSISNQSEIEGLRAMLVAEADNFIAKMKKKRRQDFSNHYDASIELLDKSELAALAESLVGLVALKQKTSLDLESVGGPIDVAVISKHDGFIWIKRKHYFSREFNHVFFNNYLKFNRESDI
jgi:hypothetical protein